jgi:hypothetical protein
LTHYSLKGEVVVFSVFAVSGLLWEPCQTERLAMLTRKGDILLSLICRGSQSAVSPRKIPQTIIEPQVLEARSQSDKVQGSKSREMQESG